MTDAPEAGAEFESPKDAGEGDAGLVKLWLSAIDLSSRVEKNWREEGQRVLRIYRNRGDERSTDFIQKDRSFNILFSNVETICPAIYNSKPIPDVRRRFGDKDEMAKYGAQVIERCLSQAIDGYDFDPIMEAANKDNELVGRGVTRVRYVPYLENDEQTGERILWEEAQCEHVPWSGFRRGPGRMWQDVPWVAFEQFLTREQLVELSPEEGGKVQLDCSDADAERQAGDTPPAEVFKRARVWEIWDKDKREVVFIAPSFKEKPLRVEPDPYQFTGFFPIPRPLVAIETSDDLVPIPPYRMYRDQAEELDRITRRITSLVEFLKVRGVRDSSIAEFDAVADAEDGDLVPMEDATALYATAGGIEKAVWLMPIDKIMVVLKELYVQREQIKSVIFEITGVADIMRGQTDAGETLGAQQIKAQWGSLRIQKKQKEIQRYAKDLFCLMAELMANRFQVQTLAAMSQVTIEIPPQPQMGPDGQPAMGQDGQPVMTPAEQVPLTDPRAEPVVQFLRSDINRQYRVDVETDSTIRADLTRSMEQMNLFVTGTAQYIGAVAPAIQAGIMPSQPVVEIYAAFARNFKLGKQAEDALDKLSEMAAEEAKQPKPPSPEEIKAKAEAEKQQAETQRAQEQFQMEMQGKQADMQMKQAEHQMRLQEMQAQLQMKREEMALKREELQMKEREMVLQSQIKERDMALGANATEHKHKLGMETMEAKAIAAKQAARQKPKGKAA